MGPLCNLHCQFLRKYSSAWGEEERFLERGWSMLRIYLNTSGQLSAHLANISPRIKYSLFFFFLFWVLYNKSFLDDLCLTRFVKHYWFFYVSHSTWAPNLGEKYNDNIAGKENQLGVKRLAINWAHFNLIILLCLRFYWVMMICGWYTLNHSKDITIFYILFLVY